jgi:HAD superfamily hydrolase (TIGR01509 family)
VALRAIIFDVDGTLAETEEAHRTAFNRAFAEAGKPWSWSEDDYRALLTTTGGKERIARYLDECGLAPDPALAAALHVRKNAIYAELVADGAVTPRPGVQRLIEEARRHDVALAIATTTSATNLAALLDHVLGRGTTGWFAVIITGEMVAVKKPDPEAYELALIDLDLPASACVAIEDSRNGLDAAHGAGIATLVTPSHYTRHEDFSGAALVRRDLDDDVTLDTMRDLVVVSRGMAVSRMSS